MEGCPRNALFRDTLFSQYGGWFRMRWERDICAAMLCMGVLTLTFEKGVEEWQTNLYLGNGGATDVEFEWHDITGVDGWQIQVSQDPLFTGESKTYYAQKCVLADGTWIH